MAEKEVYIHIHNFLRGFWVILTQDLHFLFLMKLKKPEMSQIMEIVLVFC